jgi:UDP-2,3-diacylglucosamine pyrophosphatase LpxH
VAGTRRKASGASGKQPVRPAEPEQPVALPEQPVVLPEQPVVLPEPVPPPAPTNTAAWFDLPPGTAPPAGWRAPTFVGKGGLGGHVPIRLGPSRTVVLSDLHIGTNARTCWYQQSVHEPYLAALLDWVIHMAADAHAPVTKLVILGDLFDFWTYPPEVRPPTVDDIVQANPAILGAGGKLAAAIDAVHGNAVYLHGNHDIGIVQADLDRLPLGNHKLTLVDDLIVDSGLVLTHGHLFTMFNAPDDRYPHDVPVGHFVTRAIAHLLETTLGPGQTAADLTLQGSPYGFDLTSFLPAVGSWLTSPSVTSTLLDYTATRCGLDENAPITLADGSTTTIKAAKQKYDGLWDHWVARFGGGQEGETIAAKSAQADYEGDYLAWFAQKAADDHGAGGAVTGHTHHPMQGIANSTCLYVNCGFECPATPDVTAQRAAFTFGVIENPLPLLSAQGTPELWCVLKDAHGYSVQQVPHPPVDQLVYAPFLDYSSYVSIANHTTGTLTLTSSSADSGYWVSPPPASIAAGQTARFWLQDFAGLAGTEGHAAYRTSDGTSLAFLFGCPTGILPNFASGGSSFVASSTTPPAASAPLDSVPSYGHPLFVDFTVSAESVAPGDCTPGPWTPQSALAHAVDVAGFAYDPRQDIIYSKMYPLQRSFGYAYGYDAAALGMDAIIDCEPIFFDYAGKTWMIELWKGQYGLETGCEIGVYNRAHGSTSVAYSVLDATVGRRPGDSNPAHNLFFDCVSDSELLTLSSTLHRKGQKLFCRGPQRHWWLTGFKWGVYSETTDLTMDVSIGCLDATMASALGAALTGMGYGIQTTGTTVSFTFDKPRTPQPRDSTPQLVAAVRAVDQGIVNAYDGLGLTSNDPNTVGGQAAAVIGNSFAVYGEQFFSAAIANLARLFGIDLGSLVTTLTQKFAFALQTASEIVSNVGYALTAWVNGIESWLTNALDFSCVVEVSNQGGPYTLTLGSWHIGDGTWGIAPPQSIPPGGIGRFWLKDPKPSANGSDGWVSYTWVDSSGRQQSSTFTIADPTPFWASNVATTSNGQFGVFTKSGSVTNAWGGRGSIATSGHPFFAAFVWGSGSPP